MSTASFLSIPAAHPASLGSYHVLHSWTPPPAPGPTAPASAAAATRHEQSSPPVPVPVPPSLPLAPLGEPHHTFHSGSRSARNFHFNNSTGSRRSSGSPYESACPPLGASGSGSLSPICPAADGSSHHQRSHITPAPTPPPQPGPVQVQLAAGGEPAASHSGRVITSTKEDVVVIPNSHHIHRPCRLSMCQTNLTDIEPDPVMPLPAPVQHLDPFDAPVLPEITNASTHSRSHTSQTSQHGSPYAVPTLARPPHNRASQPVGEQPSGGGRSPSGGDTYILPRRLELLRMPAVVPELMSISLESAALLPSAMMPMPPNSPDNSKDLFVRIAREQDARSPVSKALQTLSPRRWAGEVQSPKATLGTPPTTLRAASPHSSRPPSVQQQTLSSQQGFTCGGSFAALGVPGTSGLSPSATLSPAGAGGSSTSSHNFSPSGRTARGIVSPSLFSLQSQSSGGGGPSSESGPSTTLALSTTQVGIQDQLVVSSHPPESQHDHHVFFSEGRGLSSGAGSRRSLPSPRGALMTVQPVMEDVPVAFLANSHHRQHHQHHSHKKEKEG